MPKRKIGYNFHDVQGYERCQEFLLYALKNYHFEPLVYDTSNVWLIKRVMGYKEIIMTLFDEELNILATRSLVSRKR